MNPRKIRLARTFCLTAMLAIFFATARDAAAYKLYVTNEGSNNVSVIDTTTNTVIATIPVGLAPRPLAVSPDGKWVYVVNFGTNPTTISVIDTATDMVVSTITAGTGPTRVTFSLDSTVAYAVNEGSNNFTIINTSDGTVLNTFSTGIAPRACCGTSDGTRGVIFDQGSTFVEVFDTTIPSSPTLLKQIDIGMSPQDGRLTPNGAYLYVFPSGPATNIVVIDMTTLTVLTSNNVGQGTAGDIRPDGAFLYTATSGLTSLRLIDTDSTSPTFNTIVNNVATGSIPLVSAGGFLPNGIKFLAVDQTPELLVIDTDPTSLTYHTIIGTISLAGITDDDRSVSTPDSASAYLTKKPANQVRVFDLTTFMEGTAISVGTSPTHLAVTPF